MLCVVIVHVLCVYYQSVLRLVFSSCYVRALVCAMFSLQSRTSSLRSEHASLRSRGSLRSLRALRARRTRDIYRGIRGQGNGINVYINVNGLDMKTEYMSNLDCDRNKRK